MTNSQPAINDLPMLNEENKMSDSDDRNSIANLGNTPEYQPI